MPSSSKETRSLHNDNDNFANNNWLLDLVISRQKSSIYNVLSRRCQLQPWDECVQLTDQYVRGVMDRPRNGV
jgi:hypothetical protein